MEWIELKEMHTVTGLKQESLLNPGKTYVIFKHSTRCSTSRMAKVLFESEWTMPEPVYLLKVVESRQVSHAIANEYSVHHESPQLLVIRNGKCIYNNSHSMIDAGMVMKIIKSEPT